jgi:hypothetical protein
MVSVDDPGLALEALQAIERALDVLDRLAPVSSAIVCLRRLADRMEATYAQAAGAIPASHVAALTGTSLRRANEAVQLGNALAASGELRSAVSTGTVGIEQARLLGTVVNHPHFPEHAPALLAQAAALAPARLGTHLECWKSAVDPETQQSADSRQRSVRSLRFGVDLDGMTTMSARLTPEAGRVVRNALDHLVRAQRKDGTDRTADQRRADALCELAHAFASGEVHGGREVPQLLVTIEADVLLARANGAGILATGEVITPEAARRLACDAYVSPVLVRHDGEPLNVGRAERTATPAQYRALVVRDRGCAAPGCDRPPGWCQVHHLTFWEDGGRTDLDNLVLLCGAHHHLVHDDEWELTRAECDGHQQVALSPPRERELAGAR